MVTSAVLTEGNPCCLKGKTVEIVVGFPHVTCLVHAKHFYSFCAVVALMHYVLMCTAFYLVLLTLLYSVHSRALASD